MKIVSIESKINFILNIFSFILIILFIRLSENKINGNTYFDYKKFLFLILVLIIINILLRLIGYIISKNYYLVKKDRLEIFEDGNKIDTIFYIDIKKIHFNKNILQYLKKDKDFTNISFKSKGKNYKIYLNVLECYILYKKIINFKRKIDDKS